MKRLFCVLLLVLFGGHATAEALHVTRAERLISNEVSDGFPPLPARLQALPSGNWQTVTLPDVNMPRAPLQTPTDNVQTTWYRLPVADVAATGDEPLYFYLPRWQTVGQVALYGDGRLLWRSDGDPVWNSFNLPVFVNLNALDGSPRPVTLLLRMDSAAGLGGGISSVWLGPESSLVWSARARLWMQAKLPAVIGAAFLALGLFVGGIWLSRRETIYLLFFLGSLFYNLRYWHYAGALDPRVMAPQWYGWMTVNALNGLTMTALLVNFRLCKGRFGWMETGILTATAAATLFTLPLWQSNQHIAQLAVLSYALLILCSALAVAMLLYRSWRKKLRVAQALALLNLLGIGMAIHDVLLQSYHLDLERPYLMPYWEVGFCLLFSYVLLRRYLDSIQGLERSQELLASTLAQREAELAASYQQLHTIEQRQTLARERQRLMQDMHDGLGSSLTGALRMAERGSDVADIEQVLRECMDELKLTIDSLEPMEADLTLLLATLRYRLQPRLLAAGVQLHWQVQALPGLDWLTPGNALHVLRIIQEVVSNILKHAGAEQITFSTEASEFGVAVRVMDDGMGFVLPEQVGGSGRGVGNIRSRAAALSSEVQWRGLESGRGTVFTLWLPLAGPNAG